MKISFSSYAKAHDICCFIDDNKQIDAPKELNIDASIKHHTTHLVSTDDRAILCIKKPDADTPAIELGGMVIKAIMSMKAESFTIVPPQCVSDDIEAFLLGLQLGSYRFNHYYSEPKQIPPKSISVLDLFSASSNANAAQDITDGVFFARDLVSEPSNTLSPEAFKNQILEKFKPLDVKITVLDEAQIIKLGMNALHGVARGSSKPPFVVAIHYEGSKDQPTAFIGKGVCFDTGGISLKPATNMHDMKYDMGGAAAVTGALYTLAKRKAKANVVGLVGLVENMPDGNAQNPGDVVKSMSGQTIEVLNTDAEGRLVLADVITYAHREFKPKTIIDLATLTGAIVVSLGHEYSGLFSNDHTLAQQLVNAGMSSHERTWQLPIGKAYDKQIDSDIADMQNIGKRWAGSITAAQFIGRFVEDAKWAHLDIAGMAWEESGRPHLPKGATGYGVRLLNEWVRRYLEQATS
jgi:leucyl aminopeptidase